MQNRRFLLIPGLATLLLAWYGVREPQAASMAAETPILVASAVPNPVVTGPIPATVLPGGPSHDYPFYSAAPDLAPNGYVEEEFFLEGFANEYSFPAGTVVSGGHAYRTRMMVRRPANPAAFNGIVLMESQLAGHGVGLDALWASNREHIMRKGYAYVSVTTQWLAVHGPGTGLRAWSPGRYDALDVSDDGTLTKSELAFDIFSQAAQAVRHPQGVDPLGGLQSKYLIAVGVAGTAYQLATYYNSLQPTTGAFDGFMLFLGGGPTRTDLDVPVFKILSETDIANPATRQAELRQPQTDHFRRWEVAGAAMFGYDVGSYVLDLRSRDLGSKPVPVCNSPAWSHLPMHYVGNAALDAMVEWVKRGVAPPIAPDIQVHMGPPLAVVRDADGNALGGVRLPEIAVPIETNQGVNTPLTDPWCPVVGTHIPFSQQQLDARYPSHQAYVTQVIEATKAAQKAGYIVGHDAGEIRSAAAKSSIP